MAKKELISKIQELLERAPEYALKNVFDYLWEHQVPPGNNKEELLRFLKSTEVKDNAILKNMVEGVKAFDAVKVFKIIYN